MKATRYRPIAVSAIAILLLSLLYQNLAREIIFNIIGFNRIIQPLSDFPYSCRRIYNEHLEACEDLWLDEQARQLFLACTGPTSRMNWNPDVRKFNVSGRRPGGARVSVLDIDEPGQDGLYGLRQLQVVGYKGSRNDGTLDTIGFDVERVGDGALRLWMVNMQPPGNETHQPVDAAKVGANVTVELFEVDRSRQSMVHVKTFVHDAIATPNKPAAVGEGAFLVTNDKSTKFGLRRRLDAVLGGGSVAYCNSTSCHIAADRGFAFPNGMIKGADGLYYVPNILTNKISVMQLGPDLMLKEVDVIRVGMPVDNLSLDADGDIWASGFPKALEMAASMLDPFNVSPKSTIWRIRKGVEGYEVRKMVEDRDAVAISGATTTVHDTLTGRLFIGGHDGLQHDLDFVDGRNTLNSLTEATRDRTLRPITTSEYSGE
ncbi:Serum paraoxonase/arylesterase [Lachnellula suecica]|uniref:Serum paraoxonase/arylesterase n=1 Tax=Lachnellula suecica TaxID=602035 RepID=A0A8T9C469_9HELO|nr:Serum paraoxonase/arylesterase [Lachnellula suecica]